jgi:HPt (histidine-containing phosphotransfer) domain-containing protein
MNSPLADSTHSDRVPADAGIDLAQALRRLGNDSELLRELALICVEDAPGLLENAAKGLDPAQLDAAARSAHSLKGLSSNFSAAAAQAAHAAEAAIRSGDGARIESSLATLQTFTGRLIAELKRSVLESRDER